MKKYYNKRMINEVICGAIPIYMVAFYEHHKTISFNYKLIYCFLGFILICLWECKLEVQCNLWVDRQKPQ